MFTQLDPPIPLFVVGQGKGLAHGVIDYGPEFHLIWLVFLDDGGACWAAPNREVRAQFNPTMGRKPAPAAAPYPDVH